MTENAIDTTQPTVFVVDDDGRLNSAVSGYLKTMSLQVASYPSAEAFLAEVDAGRRGCLVLDLRMPGMGGLELQETLAQKGYDLPVIIVTGYADVPVAVSAIQAGAVHFLEKPFEPEDLLVVVRTALEKDRIAHEKNVRVDEQARRISRLTAREREVMQLLTSGKPTREIADLLQISTRTVEAHRARIMLKTQADSLAELTRLAIVCGMTELGV